MLSPVRRHRLQSQLSRAPELLPPQADAKQVLELLSKIFMSKDTLASDRQLMHRSLVKVSGFTRWSIIDVRMDKWIYTIVYSWYLQMIAKDPNICTPTVKALNKASSWTHICGYFCIVAARVRLYSDRESAVRFS